MGLPERWVDRQLGSGSGDFSRRVQALRFSQNLVLAAGVLALLLAASNLVNSSGASDRFFWAVFALAWLALGYVLWRQRRYLTPVFQ